MREDRQNPPAILFLCLGNICRSPLAEAGQLFKNAPAVKGAYFKVASVLE